MSSNPNNNRLSLKQANDMATRQSMADRREAWTNRIRKSKKSHLLSLKRKYYTAAANNATTASMSADTTVKASDLAQAYMQNTTSVQSLTALKDALAKKGQTTSNMQSQLQPGSLPNPLALCNALAQALHTNGFQLAAAQVLTNLAATEAVKDSESSYYGRQPVTWCSTILESQCLPSFSQVLTMFASNTSASGGDPQVVQQCCWALGNLAGDSQSSRDTLLRTNGLLESLVQVCKHGLQTPSPSLVRNAAWALSNIARGTTSARRLCGGPSLLTPHLLSQMTLSPERYSPITNTTHVTWWDVAQEGMWVVAYLTAKEDDVVQYLCSGQTDLTFSANTNTIQLCEAVACRLDQSVKSLKTTNTFQDPAALQAIRMAIPCIRAVGNIATAMDGSFLPSLLEAHDKSVAASLAALVELGSFPSSTSNADIATLATEAAWACGTLLCDAGLENHPSTDVAAPALLPKLCACVVSGYAKLELMREAVTALWNCTAAPPRLSDSMGSVWSTRGIRDAFLLDILNSDPNIVRSLTDMLVSVDREVVFQSIQLINAMLRRLSDNSNVKQQFREAQGVEALEAVCDKASSYTSFGDNWCQQQGEDATTTPAADIAADLLDDLFDDNNADDEQEMEGVAPIVSGNAFVFGLPQQQPIMNFGPPPPPAFGGGGGAPPLGRGRGRPIPSWMSK